jgi:hypothetical protein
MGMGSATPEGHFGSVDGAGIPGGVFVSTINGASGAITIVGADGVVISTAGTTITVDQNLVADWAIGITRVYAVDGVNGNDANKGFADPATTSAGDYAVACAAAGAAAKKTFAGLAAIFPRVGNGRNVEIVILGGGTTYAGTLGDVLNGVGGYLNACPFVRGTATNATAGSVAFAGSTADVTFAGATTATGLNAAGYNPTGAPTASTIQLLKVGGAAPAFGAEPAVPLGWRVRFDSATTTAALRNVCRQVCQVTGTDTILLQTSLPAVPVAGDICYLEMAGVVIGALTLQGMTQVGTGSQGLTLVGIRSTGTLTTGANCVLQMSLSGANAWSHSGLAVMVTQQSEVHPVLGVLTFGGGFRSETTIVLTSARNILNGCVSATDTTLTTPVPAGSWGPGSAARSLTAIGWTATQNDSTALAPDIGNPAATSVGTPHTFGAAGGGGLRLDGSCVSLGNINCIGAGASPAVQVLGKCSLILKGVVGGSTGNTDVGCDFQNAADCAVKILATTAPTVTGTAGDLRWAGQALAVWTNFQFQEGWDSAGNHIYQSVINAEYKHSTSRSVALGVNNSGAAIAAAYELVRNNGTNLQFVPAQADTAAHAASFFGITEAVVQNGAAGLVAAPAGLRICQFDGAPVVGGIVYLSPTTAGLATTTIPALSVTNQKLRLGVCVGNSFPGSIGLVRWNPENIPVLADGLA